MVFTYKEIKKLLYILKNFSDIVREELSSIGGMWHPAQNVVKCFGYEAAGKIL